MLFRILDLVYYLMDSYDGVVYCMEKIKKIKKIKQIKKGKTADSESRQDPDETDT